MNLEIIIVIILVVLVVALGFMAWKNSQLTAQLNRRFDEDNRRTQDKIDAMNERINEKLEQNNLCLPELQDLLLMESAQTEQNNRSNLRQSHLSSVLQYLHMVP